MLRKLKLFGIIALLAVTVVAFTSCTKENTKEKKIVGKWKVTKAKVEGEVDSEMKGNIWTFKENGNCTCEFGEDIDGEGEWSISKDELTIEFDEDFLKWTCDFTIDELTNSSMELSGIIKYKVYYDGDPYFDSYPTEFNTEFEFEKK